jgi:hypothetical protein
MQLESGSETMRGLVTGHLLVKEALAERKWLLVQPVLAMMGREGPSGVFGTTKGSTRWLFAKMYGPAFARFTA